MFGSIIAVLIEDTGQFPTVLGRVLWEENPKTINDITGFNIYRQFQTVITLKENIRTYNYDDKAMFYDNFLIILRGGECINEDY